MKTIFYCFFGIVMILQACTAKRISQFSYGGGDFRLNQERMTNYTARMVYNESIENTNPAQVELIPSPMNNVGADVIKPRFQPLKQKIKKVSAVKKLIIDKKNKYSQSSDDDMFAAIIIACSILLVVVTFWGLLKLGVSVFGVILILCLLFGLAALGASG